MVRENVDVVLEILFEEFVCVRDVWCQDYEEGDDIVELFEFEDYGFVEYEYLY